MIIKINCLKNINKNECNFELKIKNIKNKNKLNKNKLLINNNFFNGLPNISNNNDFEEFKLCKNSYLDNKSYELKKKMNIIKFYYEKEEKILKRENNLKIFLENISNNLYLILDNFYNIFNIENKLSNKLINKIVYKIYKKYIKKNYIFPLKKYLFIYFKKYTKKMNNKFHQGKSQIIIDLLIMFLCIYLVVIYNNKLNFKLLKDFINKNKNNIIKNNIHIGRSFKFKNKFKNKIAKIIKQNGDILTVLYL